VIDTDSTGLAATGWLDDVSKVEKYQISDADYDKRENTYRKYKAGKLAADPSWTLEKELAIRAGAAPAPRGPEGGGRACTLRAPSGKSRGAQAWPAWPGPWRGTSGAVTVGTRGLQLRVGCRGGVVFLRGAGGGEQAPAGAAGAAAGPGQHPWPAAQHAQARAPACPRGRHVSSVALFILPARSRVHPTRDQARGRRRHRGGGGICHRGQQPLQRRPGGPPRRGQVSAWERGCCGVSPKMGQAGGRWPPQRSGGEATRRGLVREASSTGCVVI
jgi:hypothetical protein